MKKTSSRVLDPIPLFELQHEGAAEAVKGKLRLQVRVTPLDEEFKGVPKTTIELHQQILLCRQRRLEAIYQGILAYLKVLKEDPRFFRRFNCGTLDEYHVKYGLGSGDKLGKLVALVKLFERETFVLVGDQLLNDVIRDLVAVQESTSARKRDIQRIFDRYGERHERFDREAFRLVVREYVNEIYPPKPRPTPSGPTIPPMGKPVPTSTLPISSGSPAHLPPPAADPQDGRRRVRLKPETTSIGSLVPGGPDESSGHRLVEVHCAGCEYRDRQIGELTKLVEAYERHTRDLSKVIRGECKLVEVQMPLEVKAYRKSKGLPEKP